MTDLILRIQLEAMEKNLQLVKGVLDAVRKRRDEIRELEDLLVGPEQSIRSHIMKIEPRIHSSVRDIEFADMDILDSAETSLREAKDGIEDVLASVKRARKILTKMQMRSVAIEGTEMATFAKTAAGEIEHKAEECLKTVEMIKETLRTGEARGENGKARIVDDKDPKEKAWELYAERLHGLSKEVFDEYVDFLHGLAMRDAGLDGEICQLADELTRIWKMRDVDHSLTIPTRQEAITSTLARIIRLGFPEWTIWALPLTAHELGHVVASKNEQLRGFVEEEGAIEPARSHLEDYLADAFATYVMGPAYAFAAVLMRFNPVSAYDDDYEHPADAKRAYFVFNILQLMNEQADLKDPYTGIIDQLRLEWNAALEQAKQPVKLETRDEEQLNKWIASLKAKDLLRKAITVTYSADRWDSAVELQGKIEQHLKDGERGIEQLGSLELRDVLNAAWLSRIHNPGKTQMIENLALALFGKLRAKEAKVKGKPLPFRPTRTMRE